MGFRVGISLRANLGVQLTFLQTLWHGSFLHWDFLLRVSISGLGREVV
uniref:Uncharacterized protein n=1 Tax=Rhizophora mucronata TaxID=61149 RepID=A0A2P2J2H3_RHIMU